MEICHRTIPTEFISLVTDVFGPMRAPDKRYSPTWKHLKKWPLPWSVVARTEPDILLELDGIGGPSVPLEILESFAGSGDYSLVWLAANHPCTPEETLDRLAESDQVRHDVAANPSTPIETLERLARDEDALLAQMAKTNLQDRRSL